MATLIDGYNLLHAAGIIPAGREQGSLESARRELLNFLFHILPDNERQQTTIVFDARKAPPGLPHEMTFRGIQILFAHNHDEADDLIEELIRVDHVPRKLVVVSSDHRIQRAANRRRAKSIDSDQWYWQLRERRNREQRETNSSGEWSKPEAPLGDGELAHWLSIFGDMDIASTESPTARSSDINDPDVQETTPNEAAADEIQKNGRDKPDVMENPFPPGYGEDLLIDYDVGDIFPPGYGDDLRDDDG